MELPLTLQLKTSRCFGIILASGHALAGVAVFLLPVPWAIRAAGLLGLGFSFWHSWRPGNVNALVLRSDGLLDVCYADGSETRASVSPTSVVWSWLVILHMRTLSALVIFPDGLSGADAHRQLRIWLKWRSELNPAAAE